MFSVVFGVCEIDNFVKGSNLYYHKTPCCSFTCLFFFCLYCVFPGSKEGDAAELFYMLN
jgi:hypothetical protein